MEKDNEEGSLLIKVELTVTTERFVTNSELWYQDRYSRCLALSLSSQVMMMLSPRLTCFSVEPNIIIIVWRTWRHYEFVLTPVDVGACQWYSPWSLGCTPSILRAHTLLLVEWITLYLWSLLSIFRPVLESENDQMYCFFIRWFIPTPVWSTLEMVQCSLAIAPIGRLMCGGVSLFMCCV